MTTETTPHPEIVGQAEWLAARKALLTEEKAATRPPGRLGRFPHRLATTPNLRVKDAI